MQQMDHVGQPRQTRDQRRQDKAAFMANGDANGPKQTESTPMENETDQPVSSTERLDDTVAVESLFLQHSFNGQGLRTAMEAGEARFIMPDVCAILEISNPRDAFSRLEDDEKGVVIADTLGGRQEINVITESGLYALIFRSRKPQARAFRRWVTGEVLPSIRKTGRYDASRKPSNEIGGECNRPGRYTTVITPDGKKTTYAMPLDSLVDEATEIDVRIMAHEMKTVEALWAKVQQMVSIGLPPAGGFALTRLEAAILEGGRLATYYLGCYRPPA